jgi:hypothetical protein
MLRAWVKVTHPWEPAFRQQRDNAKKRGIAWELTFEQWRKIWEDSHHWKNRGRHTDEYCMARYNDVGTYEIGNVRILTNRDNHLERKPHKHTKKFRKAMSNRLIGNRFGRGQRIGFKHSDKAKAAISHAISRLWKSGKYDNRHIPR